MRGGLLDCKLKITDPSGGVVIEKIAYFNKEDDALNEAEGRVQFSAAQTGKYTVCFDNTMSRWTAKVVSFFVLNDAAAPDPKEAVAKLQDLGPTVDSVIKIADELDAIENIQHHMRVREQSHRDGQTHTRTAQRIAQQQQGKDGQVCRSSSALLSWYLCCCVPSHPRHEQSRSVVGAVGVRAAHLADGFPDPLHSHMVR